MGVMWWIGQGLVIYCSPGIYFFLQLIEVPIPKLPNLPEDVIPYPYPWWFRAIMYTSAFGFMLVFWPVALWMEVRGDGAETRPTPREKSEIRSPKSETNPNTEPAE